MAFPNAGAQALRFALPAQTHPRRRTRAEHCVMDKIHIEGLEKTYASKSTRVTAFTQINLTISKNEFITLKSTVLKLIGLLIRFIARPSCSMTAWPYTAAARRGIVFQEAAEWRSVLDNVLLPAEILRPDKRKARAMASTFSTSSALPDSSSVSLVNCRAACSSGSRSSARSFTTRQSC
jgi:ABC-type taurine transport system ATPase subunit